MDRRQFIRRASGLFVAAAPAIILPKLVRAQGGMGPGPGTPHSAGGLGLQTDLGSFFSLDNTLADATGNVTDLTNNNSVTFVSSAPSPIAAVSNTAKFVSASSQSLTHADATGISVAGINFSLSFWMYDASNGTNVLAKGTNSFGSNEYRFDRPFAANLRFELNNSGVFGPGGTIVGSAWHHVVVTFNNTSKAAVMYVDGSQVATNTYGGSSAAGAGTLWLGSNYAGSSFFDGNLCLFGTWRNRILSAGDVTLLYNSGNGLSYAAMA